MLQKIRKYSEYRNTWKTIEILKIKEIQEHIHKYRKIFINAIMETCMNNAIVKYKNILKMSKH